MSANKLTLTLRVIALALVVGVTTLPAQAHPRTDAVPGSGQTPSIDAPVEVITGAVRELIVDNRLTGMTARYVGLRLDDGRNVTLRNSGLETLAQGTRVEATGQLDGDTLFATGFRLLAGSATPSSALIQAEGTLAVVHSDNFEQGRSAYSWVIRGAGESATPLQLVAMPSGLDIGMHVVASGTMAADGFSLDTSQIIILAAPPPLTAGVLATPTTNNVLVVLIKFSAASDPFSQADVDQVTRTNGNSVANYYQEVSYGQHLLNVTVTPWMLSASAAPASCDYTAIGAAGDAAATAAGYTPASYQNRFYVFPFRGDCGWAGLAYVGFGQAWSNGYNQLGVYGHELGHNFGLLHAASLYCPGQVIGGSCSSSEYGDPFDVMGNISAMHFNSRQKSLLNWIPASSVQTFTTGSMTYTLSPIESPDGTTYAVKIPVSASRTYWIEYRQPIGFDSGMSSYPNNGAQIRVASPFESLCSGCADDTELLDMTPGTANSFGDAALIAGHSYTDAATNITVSVLSASPIALSVQVSSSGTTATTTMVTTSLTPSTEGQPVTFTATVTGSNPSGSVTFTDSGASIAGCIAVALSGAGNTKTATCSTSSLAAGAHSIGANYGGDAVNAASSSAAISQSVNSVGGAFGNGGFEAPNLGGSYQYSPSGATWVFSGGAGITGNGNAFTSGNGVAPEGSQVGFLQRNGMVAQTVNLTAGSYTLSFQAAQRGNYQVGTQIVLVQLDGVTVGQYQPPGTTYSGYTTPGFTVASSGSHTISLVGAGSGSDFTAFIDDVRLTAGSTPAFTNGGFESPNLAGGYQYSPSGATWIFTVGAGITGNGNAFTSGNGVAPEGSQVAFLQGNGMVAQTANLTVGSYTLSFQSAQRGNYQVGTQIVLVQLDGITVGQYQPPGTAYSGYTTPAFTVASSGSHTISLVGAGSGSDFTAFVDDVRLQ
jgi:Bacterial Ig-like domain (group 3)/Gametolysin peptidase M11